LAIALSGATAKIDQGSLRGHTGKRPCGSSAPPGPPALL